MCFYKSQRKKWNAFMYLPSVNLLYLALVSLFPGFFGLFVCLFLQNYPRASNGQHISSLLERFPFCQCNGTNFPFEAYQCCIAQMLNQACCLTAVAMAFFCLLLVWSFSELFWFPEFRFVWGVRELKISEIVKCLCLLHFAFVHGKRAW